VAEGLRLPVVVDLVHRLALDPRFGLAARLAFGERSVPGDLAVLGQPDRAGGTHEDLADAPEARDEAGRAR
jgi:hypothetical protein